MLLHQIYLLTNLQLPRPATTMQHKSYLYIYYLFISSSKSKINKLVLIY